MGLLAQDSALAEETGIKLVLELEAYRANQTCLCRVDSLLAILDALNVDVDLLRHHQQLILVLNYARLHFHLHAVANQCACRLLKVLHHSGSHWFVDCALRHVKLVQNFEERRATIPFLKLYVFAPCVEILALQSTDRHEEGIGLLEANLAQVGLHDSFDHLVSLFAPILLLHLVDSDDHLADTLRASQNGVFLRRGMVPVPTSLKG